MTEAVAEDAEGSRLVSEPLGDILGGPLFDEVGTEGFVLSLAGVGRFEEEASLIRDRFWFTYHGSAW